MLARACYFAAAKQSQKEVHHFLLGRSAYARLIYNLDPFCVLNNLYSVAVDASIPLLFSYRVYRDSATTGHVVVAVISVAVSPSSITSRLRLFFHIPSELLHDF